MSWWAHLDEAGPVGRFEDGGTYPVGGTDEPELNVTYNYGRTWRTVAGFEDFTLSDLDGKRAGDTIATLAGITGVLGTIRTEDYWDPTPGNAGHALSVLLGWARQYPDATWRVF